MVEQKEIGLTMPSQGPYSYGIDLQGNLVIGFVSGYLPGPIPVKTHLVLPTEELDNLRSFLNQTKEVQLALSEKPPTSTPQ